MSEPQRDAQQAPGPGIPRVDVLVSMLRTVPEHCEIREVVINGQTGIVFIKYHHEDLDMTRQCSVFGFEEQRRLGKLT